MVNALVEQRYLEMLANKLKTILLQEIPNWSTLSSEEKLAKLITFKAWLDQSALFTNETFFSSSVRGAYKQLYTILFIHHRYVDALETKDNKQIELSERHIVRDLEGILAQQSLFAEELQKLTRTPLRIAKRKIEGTIHSILRDFKHSVRSKIPINVFGLSLLLLLTTANILKASNDLAHIPYIDAHQKERVIEQSINCMKSSFHRDFKQFKHDSIAADAAIINEFSPHIYTENIFGVMKYNEQADSIVAVSTARVATYLRKCGIINEDEWAKCIILGQHEGPNAFLHFIRGRIGIDYNVQMIPFIDTSAMKQLPDILHLRPEIASLIYTKTGWEQEEQKHQITKDVLVNIINTIDLHVGNSGVLVFTMVFSKEKGAIETHVEKNKIVYFIVRPAWHVEIN